MNRKITRSIAALLCLCLLLGGCGGSLAEEAAPDPAPAAGRYVEETAPLPALSMIHTLQEVGPDNLYILGEGRDGAEIWHSGNGGRSWEQMACADLSELSVLSAAFLPDGSAYVSHLLDYTEEGIVVGLARVDGEAVTALPATYDAYNWGMTATASGALLLDRAFSFVRVNPQTGEAVEHELNSGQLFPGSYVAYEETVAAVLGANILLLDTESGESGTLPLAVEAGYGTALAVEADRSGFFYLDHDGLYRVTMDGALTEQLIDGALTSFGMPTVYVERLLACTDGSFLILYQDAAGYQLLRYVFRADLPREPEQRLVVYSLRDNDYLRQAIGLYQREHPELMVRFEVGLPDGTAVTAEDAVRTLATRLLAEDGPDLLVLDGLPVDGYIRNGALLDLDGHLQAELSDMIPTAASAYRRDGGLYAVPARVTMPILLGTGAGEIDGLGGLMDYLEAQEPRYAAVGEWLSLERFYPLAAPGWFGADGALDADALAQGLRAVERLAAVAASGRLGRWGGTVDYQAMYWAGDGQPLVFGQLERLDQAAELYTALEMRGEGELVPFPAAGNGACLLPGTVLGVVSTGAQTALALDFVRFALDADTQLSTTRAGMPSGRGALERAAAGKQPGDAHSSFASSFNDTGERYQMKSLWPTETQMREMLDLILTAELVVPGSEVLLQMVYAEAEALLAGSGTVEDAMQTLTAKVARYVQEQVV